MLSEIIQTQRKTNTVGLIHSYVESKTTTTKTSFQTQRTNGWSQEVGTIDEGSQKVQTSSYKNKSWGCDASAWQLLLIILCCISESC